MLNTVERLRLILTLKKHFVSLGLLQEYASDILLKLCEGIVKYKAQKVQYLEHIAIQKELINDERFFFYLDKLSSANISPTMINKNLNELHSRGEHGIDYSIGRLISSMVLTASSKEVFYDYLKHFSGLPSSKQQKNNIIHNLAVYGGKLAKPLPELMEAEKFLFMESCLTNRSLIPDAFNRAFSLLQHTGMLNIIRFINENGYRVSLSIDDYEVINKSAESILGHFKYFRKLFNSRYMEMLLKRWLDNNCSLYDLEVLRSKITGMEEDQLFEVLNSRSGYINLIYESKISNIPLAIIPRHKEDILIYAITQKKNGFIRLIEENPDAFNCISSNSILYKREFYSQYFNLNSFNINDLNDCRILEANKIIFGELVHDRVYTFNELKALYGLPVQYYKLYAALSIPRIDSRLIAFKQVTKGKLLTFVEEDESIYWLAEMLSLKPLSEWRDKEFAHIEGVKLQDIVDLLIHFKKIEKLAPQLKSKTEAKLLVRNRDYVHKYGTIDEMKADLSKIDCVWSDLIQKLGYSDKFLRKHSERVCEFLCVNNAEIANIYYDKLKNDSQREALRRIVQAELMGELRKLKYYADDLRKEIDYSLNPAEKSLWLVNTKAFIKDVLIKECDDFYSTMILGVLPQRTCLSYYDGEYLDCLLSGFDSNKKVLFAYIDGKIVGRAIIRLTKGKFIKKNVEPESELSFVDLEAVELHECYKQEEAEKDRLVLFLERSYTAGISDENGALIDDMYVDLMDKKAKKIGAMLILSNSYVNITRNDFTRTLFHVYISKSKAGAQYLDSLNGAAVVSDEGGYRTNKFLIRKDDIL